MAFRVANAPLYVNEELAGSSMRDCAQCSSHRSNLSVSLSASKLSHSLPHGEFALLVPCFKTVEISSTTLQSTQNEPSPPSVPAPAGICFRIHRPAQTQKTIHRPGISVAVLETQGNPRPETTQCKHQVTSSPGPCFFPQTPIAVAITR